MGKAGSSFLPASRSEMLNLGWKQPDIVLVTGDAYVDHPSFGVAIIARWLEANGFRVAVLAQPRYWLVDDFLQFGRPRLFFGITAGNMDSIVANYTGNSRVRKSDPFSPEGNPWFGKDRVRSRRRRPDRASIIYANLARQAFSGVPVVLGGIEASLRRFVHYDFQQEKLRRSILADSKADLLIYGMGERAVLEIARRLQAGEALSGIPGTCERLVGADAGRYDDRQDEGATIRKLPSWQAIQQDLSLFLKAELEVDRSARALSDTVLVQDQGSCLILQNPPAPPLSENQLDFLYELPFTRRPHPSSGKVPAWEMIRDSVTAVRGCYGNCSFCAIARHQGPVITCRSRGSVIAEIEKIAAMKDFKGTISDVGGPTANMYGTSCSNPAPCRRHDCLFPKVCRHLNIDENAFFGLLSRASQVPGVRHLFVSSGLRMDLLVRTPRLLERLLARHTSGVMKIAPEHTHSEVLRIMHKPGSRVLEEFLRIARGMCRKMGLKAGFNPYLISAHPGCKVSHMRSLAADLKRLGLKPRQFQDFTPTPGTISTAMYVTGLDRDSGKKIFVARNRKERMRQRRILEQAMKQGR